MEVLAQIESSGDPNAYNKGSQARGLYQITPICLKHYNQNPNKVFQLDPPWNEDGSSNFRKANVDDLFNEFVNFTIANWYLNWLSQRCDSVFEILVGFNWGPGNLRKWRRGGSKWNKLPNETRNYVEKYARLTNQTIVGLGYEKI